VARSSKSVSIVLFLLVALSFAQAAPQSRIVQAIDGAQFVPLQGSGHPLARPEFDRGPVDPSMLLHLVSLNFKKSAAQQKALDTLLAEQQDRASANYHKWLTPELYADRFGLAPADIARISAWLVSQGFTVDRVARGRTRISFTGAAAQIESVFHSEIHQYEVNGEQHYANAGEISLPAALANVVLGLTGLNDFRPKPHSHRMPVSPHFTDSPGNFALVPEDFATIYGVQALYDQGIDGTGQTIAVAGGSAITLSNIATFRSRAGLPVNTPTVIVVPGGGTPTGTNAEAQLEAYLDVEWAGAVAKNAQILFVNTGPNDPEQAFDAVQFSVDNDLAPVISISFGNCEVNFTENNSDIVQGWAQEANSQGQTIAAASGDSGAADCDSGASATHGLAVDVPAAIPEITGVGGSEFLADVANPNTYWNSVNDADFGSAKKYIPEEVWDDTTLAIANGGGLTGGGGGVSTFFLIPAWQSGAGFITSGRNVPDIALNASNFHDFYLLCIGTDPQDGLPSCSNGFLDSSGEPAGVGGTSAGAPTFAGMLALLDQAIDPTGVGNVNLQLYPLAASAPLAFNDITSGSNLVPCTTGSSGCPTTGAHPGQIGYTAAAGYDQASGLGSINANTLVTSWPGFTPAATFTVGGPAVTIASPGSSGTSTITVDPLNSFSGTVTLTCTPPPSTALITCTITPSVDVTGSPATATLTIHTTAAHVALASSATPKGPKGMGWFMVSGAGLFASVLVMGVPSRRRKSTAMFGLALFAFMVTGIACGGGGSSSTGPINPGTPAAVYTVGVTAVSGSITRPSTVFVTVN
jgi:subtilase family serine protease